MIYCKNKFYYNVHIHIFINITYKYICTYIYIYLFFGMVYFIIEFFIFYKQNRTIFNL